VQVNMREFPSCQTGREGRGPVGLMIWPSEQAGLEQVLKSGCFSILARARTFLKLRLEQVSASSVYVSHVPELLCTLIS